MFNTRGVVWGCRQFICMLGLYGMAMAFFLWEKRVDKSPLEKVYWSASRFQGASNIVNLELLEKARTRIPSAPVLINLTSKRVRQLNSGMKPYVKPLGNEEDKLDVALREIAEGKIIAEVDFDAITRRQEALSKRMEDF